MTVRRLSAVALALAAAVVFVVVAAVVTLALPACWRPRLDVPLPAHFFAAVVVARVEHDHLADLEPARFFRGHILDPMQV